jgi:hypothetical protein
MHPWFFRREEWSLEMNTENARLASHQRLDRRHGGSRLFGRIRDESRDQRGGAKLPMRLRDFAYGLGRRRIVEQDVPATVHLNVDEPWNKP